MLLILKITPILVNRNTIMNESTNEYMNLELSWTSKKLNQSNILFYF